MTDLISGVVDLFLIGQSSAKAQAGLIKNLAITSATRSPLLPDLPTMQESGVPGYELRGWFGMLAPAKTPQPVIDMLSQAVKTAAADPRFVQALVPEGLEILANSPDEMRAMIAAETAKWGEVVKATGVKLEQ